MKRILCLMAIVLPMLILSSCGGDDEEPEVKIYADMNEIQGSWVGLLSGIGYTFQFYEDGKYFYMSMRGKDVVHQSWGTYSIVSHKFEFNATKGDDVPWNGEEVTWTNKDKKILQVGKYLLLHPSSI